MYWDVESVLLYYKRVMFIIIIIIIIKYLNNRTLSELDVRKQYLIEISNRFAALENLSDGEDINRAWENVKENIKTSAKESLGLHELKQHKP